MRKSGFFLILSFFVLSGCSHGKLVTEARNGDAIEQYKIGWNYANGVKGFERNELKAIEWLEKSAENGYHPAQYYLGWFYFYGHGVRKDLNKATYWYGKAAALGNEHAKEMLRVCQLHSDNKFIKESISE